MYNLQKEIHLEEAIDSVRTSVQNAFKLLACILLDIICLVLYGVLTTPIYDKLQEHIIIIGTFISEGMQKSGRTYINNTSLVDILFSQQARPYVFKFILLLLLLGTTVYILYVVFQGTIWKIASSLAGYQIAWNEYLKAFAKTNLLWFGIFVVYYFGSLFLQIRSVVLTKINPSYAPSTAWEVIFAMVLAVILYFAILSYISGGIKIGFKAGLHGWRQFAPAIIFLMILFLTIDYLMLRAGLINTQLAYLLGVVLFLPALTIAKVYMFKIAAKLANNGILPQY